MMDIQAYTELFHLFFLKQLEGKLDKKLYSLKGGCNLRFFFKSIRYSEDIDFDVSIISKSTLENKVNKILASIDFRRILQSRGIQIIQFTPSKQTNITQRWKILLGTEVSTVPIPTKIEFSRRKLAAGTTYAAINSDIINQHHLYPIICNHYERDAAFMQKVDALINRSETQARDVFDLKWLLDQGASSKLMNFSRPEILTAVENIHGITFAHFKGQVIAYLMDEYREYYDSSKIWDEMCAEVIRALQRERPCVS